MNRSNSAIPSRARWAVLALAVVLGGCDPLGLAGWFADRPEGTSVLMLLDTDDRRLEVGSEVEGALSSADWLGTNGAYLEAWSLKADRGDSFSIDLTSSDFDAYLYVVGPGIEGVLSDDDSGGACHARIDLTVLEPGTFHVVASSNGSERTGTYQLQVNAEPDAVAAVSCGGLDGAALISLPTQGRELRRNETAYGQLTGAEPSVQNGRPVQAWALEGRAGETVVISQSSDDFDSYLYVAGPGMAEALTNDDGGSGLDSELTVTFPANGTYIVGAGALSSGSSGSYALTLSEPVDLASLDTDDRAVRLDELAYGMLSDFDPVVEGRRVQAWAFRAEAGQRVTIDLMSEDFDSYLQVAGPGLGSPLTDDDGGEGLDSRIDITFPADGTYRIIAGSLSGDGGSFTLRVW